MSSEFLALVGDFKQLDHDVVAGMLTAATLPPDARKRGLSNELRGRHAMHGGLLLDVGPVSLAETDGLDAHSGLVHWTPYLASLTTADAVYPPKVLF